MGAVTRVAWRRHSTDILMALDYAALDAVMRHLSNPSPFLSSAPPAPRTGIHVLAVAGNWYDLPHKAPVLARLASHRPSATLLLTGGRDERLTPPRAVELGGEPMMLQSQLHELHNVSRSRMVIYSGSRITNHNLRAMLMFASTTHAFERRAVNLQIVEEAFLVRREAAAFRALLNRDSAAASALDSVHIRPVGARSFDQLVNTHGGRVDVALALVLGEVTRLRQYSNASRHSADDEVLLPAEAAQLDDSLSASVDRMLVEQRDRLLSSGRALLGDRTRLFASGAAPRAVGDGLDGG